MDNEELLRVIDNTAKKRLATLFLFGKKLTQLPPEIGKLTDLTEFYLPQNKLTQLPPEIGLLTNLTTLGLSQNQLTQLPSEIGQLTNLTKLRLSQNQLTQLPSEIDKLTKLTSLWLENNELIQLPPEISKLRNLDLLYLENNKLTQLPPEMDRLTKLDFFNLKGNNFNVPDEVLNKEDPQEIIRDILFANYRKSQIVNGGLLVSISTQRNLKEDEFAKITAWLDIFRIKAFFMVDNGRQDIELSENSETALHEIKQYLSDKQQDHISQVYNQKTQAEK